MRAAIIWTPDLDATLRRLRSEGETWDRIAAALGLGRNTVLERGRKIGARRMPRPQPAPLAVPEPRDRPARPAGHPQSWGLLTKGTLLDGEPYPFPVFL